MPSTPKKRPTGPAKRSRSRSPSARADVAPSTGRDWVVHNESVLMCLPSVADVARCVVYRRSEGSGPSELCVRIAAFDLDDTIITPKSGAVFAKSADDWRFLLPSVVDVVRHAHSCGYLSAILSNQSGIGKAKCEAMWDGAKAVDLKRRVEGVVQALAVPCVVLLAAKEDEFRKPSEDLWLLLEAQISALARAAGLPQPLNGRALSFYVGDAAGRSVTTAAGRKKDFSCSDRKFAYNCGVPFMTPEQFFRAEKNALFAANPEVTPVVAAPADAPTVAFRSDFVAQLQVPNASPAFDWGGLGPADLKALPTSYDQLAVRRLTPAGEDVVRLSHSHPLHRSMQEMVIFVGFPGCGKTTVFRRYFQPHGYGHVNRDTLKTSAKCIAVAEQLWRSGRSVVVDNTNPSAADRHPYVQLVQKLTGGSSSNPLPVRVISFSHSKALAMHMNVLRARLGIAPRISSIVFNVFMSKFEPVTIEYVAKNNLTEALLLPAVASFHDQPERALELFYQLT